MNRFVSLLLVALSLAAISLAQPAQAQSPQWIQGSLYYDKNNTAILDDYYDTTITSKPVGFLTLTSNPLAHGRYDDAFGNANGGLIHQDYLWIDQPNLPGTSFTSTDNSIIYKNAAENPCGLSLGMNAALPFRRQDIRALRNLAGCGTIDV